MAARISAAVASPALHSNSKISRSRLGRESIIIFCSPATDVACHICSMMQVRFVAGKVRLVENETCPGMSDAAHGGNDQCCFQPQIVSALEDEAGMNAA